MTEKDDAPMEEEDKQLLVRHFAARLSDLCFHMADQWTTDGRSIAGIGPPYGKAKWLLNYFPGIEYQIANPDPGFKALKARIEKFVEENEQEEETPKES